MQWTREKVLGWGRAVGGDSEVLRPSDPEQIVAALQDAHERGLALRGSGCSYGDASTNPGGRVLDLRGMNRILDFDAEQGVARVQPGVTIRQLWTHTIPHGYWPAVVPGTQAVSMGGAASMNIHGKNNFAVGTFGDHVQSFKIATPTGDGLIECSRQQHADLFRGAIAGFGMLGCITELEVKLKRVYSGRMKVWGIPTRDLDDNLSMIEDLAASSDYLVGWIDLHAKGRDLGRGEMHRAVHYAQGEDPEGERMLSPEQQDVPTTLFGVVPKGWIWPGMWVAAHTGMVRFVNWAKFRASFGEGRKSPYPQAHGGFHFLLDYVPNWNRAFSPLIQFQPFIPARDASRVLRKLIEMCHAAGPVPYLGVLKRHRPDEFLMTHSVDGFSMAMDFNVSGAARRKAVWELTHRMADVVLDAGGAVLLREGRNAAGVVIRADPWAGGGRAVPGAEGGARSGERAADGAGAAVGGRGVTGRGLGSLRSGSGQLVEGDGGWRGERGNDHTTGSVGGGRSGVRSPSALVPTSQDQVAPSCPLALLRAERDPPRRDPPPHTPRA